MEYFLKLFEDKIWLSENCYSLLAHSPALSAIQEINSPVWMRVKKVVLSSERFFCEFLGFVQSAAFSSSQRIDLDDFGVIGKVEFRHLDTELLFSELREKAKFVSVKTANTHSIYKPIHRSISIENSAPIRVLKEEVELSIKQLKFETGFFSFEHKLKGFSKRLSFEIPNPNIRVEFEAVKLYFHNALEKRKFPVHVKIEVKVEEILSRKARSVELEKLDQNLIDTVAFKMVKEISNSKKLFEIDKSLFTADEFFDLERDKTGRKDLWISDDIQLLEMMLKIKNALHFFHLRYLSGKHAAGTMKLRFILKPLSFLFLLEGKYQYHLVWETLDSKEATYIWHVEKGDKALLKQKVERIEMHLNTIKIEGRNAYLNSNEADFSRVFHDYSQLQNGFVKWKSELESLLY